MFSLFYLSLLIAAALIGLLVVYGNKYTLPSYEGKGNRGTLLLAVLLGIVGLYVLQFFTGVHYFADASTILTFGTKFDNSTMKAATWLLFGGLASLVGVGAFNTWRYGRVNM